jgi:hypothetical protein
VVNLPQRVRETSCAADAVAVPLSLPGTADVVEAPIVRADGTVYALTLASDGTGRLRFDADTDHGDWRLLAAEGLRIDAMIGGESMRVRSLSVTDPVCAPRFATTFPAHIHALGLWEVELSGPAGLPHAFSVVLEGSGH